MGGMGGAMSARDFFVFLLTAFLGIFGAGYYGSLYGRKGVVLGLILGIVLALLVCVSIWLVSILLKARKNRKR